LLLAVVERLLVAVALVVCAQQLPQLVAVDHLKALYH
jgi:hypothetical protein